MLKVLLSIALYLYTAFCVVWILMWPLNEYEWMLSDPDAQREGLTFCGLPLDSDADVKPLFAALPLVPLTVLAVVVCWRARRLRPSAWLAAALWLVWLAKFYLLAPQC